jgi:hypothetical protein
VKNIAIIRIDRIRRFDHVNSLKIEKNFDHFITGRLIRYWIKKFTNGNQKLIPRRTRGIKWVFRFAVVDFSESDQKTTMIWDFGVWSPFRDGNSSVESDFRRGAQTGAERDRGQLTAESRRTGDVFLSNDRT